ncbi:Succinate-semialdehyde dehydrogenase [NAD] [Methanosarcina siciliae HI350]|nr:Succinate-semialdehyde dehydrogenase [NAD] [Methanosarcina siciliae HI350]
MKIKSVNPYTEEINRTYDSFSIEECRTRIEKSRAAFSEWSSLPAEERAKSFSNVAKVLRQNTEIYAGVITEEMGEPIRQSRSEVQKCARLCDYYAENAAGLLKDEGQSCTAAKRFIIVKEVVGDFIEAFERHMQELKIGDPMDEETDLGPLAKKICRKT